VLNSVTGRLALKSDVKIFSTPELDVNTVSDSARKTRPWIRKAVSVARVPLNLPSVVHLVTPPAHPYPACTFACFCIQTHSLAVALWAILAPFQIPVPFLPLVAVFPPPSFPLSLAFSSRPFLLQLPPLRIQAPKPTHMNTNKRSRTWNRTDPRARTRASAHARAHTHTRPCTSARPCIRPTRPHVQVIRN